MGIVISDQILNESKECRQGFCCLQTGQDKDPKVCEVLDANGKNVLFLKTKKIVECPYQVSFGESLICTCPTHYAIHKKYGK
ncbi:MAG: hypothetical protein GQ571_04525 [Desulfobacterales bacterium]|jgi:hypothetical protein|nr:hypothetical protein [Desulfobacterales bacterium]